MAYHGFEAAPADFAAAAPRIAGAADGLRAALGAADEALAEHGPFWGEDEDFELGYRVERRETGELAARCDQALRAMAQQLAGAATSYAAVDAAAAESFRALGVRLGAGDAEWM